MRGIGPFVLPTIILFIAGIASAWAVMAVFPVIIFRITAGLDPGILLPFAVNRDAVIKSRQVALEKPKVPRPAPDYHWRRGCVAG